MNFDDNVRTHLGILQTTIARMAANSFQMKAWSIALGTAAIGFAAAKEGYPRAALLGLIPLCGFWGLHAYYLALERKFRAIFDSVIEGKCTVPFTMRPAETGADDWFAMVFRPAVFWIHFPIGVVVAGVGRLV